jgi:hypothetical protein
MRPWIRIFVCLILWAGCGRNGLDTPFDVPAGGVTGTAGGSALPGSGGASGGRGGVTGTAGTGGTGGVAGTSGGSGGLGDAGGGAAGGGGNQIDAGAEAGRDAAPTSCGSCGTGKTCAYAIADGCSAVGTCVSIPPVAACDAVTTLTGCGCDGRTVTWHGGCHADLPNGYAPAPIVHTGSCP